MPMRTLVTGLLAAILALGSLSAAACPGDQAKEEKQISTPSKPKG